VVLKQHKKFIEEIWNTTSIFLLQCWQNFSILCILFMYLIGCIH